MNKLLRNGRRVVDGKIEDEQGLLVKRFPNRI